MLFFVSALHLSTVRSVHYIWLDATKPIWLLLIVSVLLHSAHSGISLSLSRFFLVELALLLLTFSKENTNNNSKINNDEILEMWWCGCCCFYCCCALLNCIKKNLLPCSMTHKLNIKMDCFFLFFRRYLIHFFSLSLISISAVFFIFLFCVVCVALWHCVAPSLFIGRLSVRVAFIEY